LYIPLRFLLYHEFHFSRSGASMLLLRRVVAEGLARLGKMTRQIRALPGPGWAALLGSLGACVGSDPRIPTSVSLSTFTVSFSALGQTQQLSPSVTDQDGKALAASVSWSSSNTGVATVSQSGLVTAVGAGSADVTATAGSASATAQVTVIQTPTQLLKVSGDAQTGTAGTTLSAPLIVQVNDAYGNPIPGRTATFTVTQGDGSTGSATVVTGTDGRASTTFTTGTASGSPQEVSVSIAATALSVSFTATAAADPSTFNIGLQYLSTTTATQRQAFSNARLRWQAAITGDLEDGLLDTAGAEACPGSGTPAFNQDIDDVVILVSLVSIDGPGNVLASAGPCYIRDFDPPTTIEPGDLTILGLMQFDTDDLPSLESAGLLSTVILHEMGHVLGFGVLWGEQGLLADPSLPPADGTDPHFTGAQALNAFANVGGAAYVAGAKVPVERNGGLGTADSHWRDSVFVNELMTGYVDPGRNPLSVVTLASLADQGYAVDLATADAYSLMLSLRAFDTTPKLLLKNDILRGPIRKVDRSGRVTGELRR
jgi:hypothetical protein